MKIEQENIDGVIGSFDLRVQKDFIWWLKQIDELEIKFCNKYKVYFYRLKKK